jgi:hypothetical protein
MTGLEASPAPAVSGETRAATPDNLLAFDPVQETAKLQEHLSSGQPFVLLAGAGTSAAVTGDDGKPLVPAVKALTELCRDRVVAIDTWGAAYWSKLVDSLSLALSRPADKITIEDILSAVRLKIDALADGDRSFDIGRDELRALEKVVTATIAEAATITPGKLQPGSPQRSVARWIGSADRRRTTEVFTTNYDTLIEQALEDERVPYFDGFVGTVRPFFSAASMTKKQEAPAHGWTRVWKLHGSVNWERVDDPEGGLRIVRREEVAEAHMILPSALKYDQSRKLPYMAMLDRLTQALTHSSDTVILVVGFSFGDQHINDLLREALENEHAPHLVALQFEDPEPDDALWTLATRHRNVMVFGPRTAIIGGQVGRWKLLDVPGESSRVLLDQAFLIEDETNGSGRFLLGDFAKFGTFLDRIATRA